jgi:hypothetical protein
VLLHSLTNLQLAWLAQLTTLARINAGRERELMPPTLQKRPGSRTAEINGGLAPESESEEGGGGGHGGDQEASRPTSRNASAGAREDSKDYGGRGVCSARRRCSALRGLCVQGDEQEEETGW